jgi:hypothetical protein
MKAGGYRWEAGPYGNYHTHKKYGEIKKHYDKKCRDPGGYCYLDGCSCFTWWFYPNNEYGPFGPFFSDDGAKEFVRCGNWRNGEGPQ